MKPLASFALLVIGASPTLGQTGRAALAAGHERYLLADYHAAAPLLARGLDPNAGHGDSLWRQGVERLVDVFLVLRQDSLAATWLRWAARLDPEFDVDDEAAPPAVVRAARAARAFVDSTPHDRFVARVGFQWSVAARADAPGTFHLGPASIPITARIGTDQFLRGGESRRLTPGSYDVVVSAPGFLPTRLTLEILPGVTTGLDVSLLPETAGLLYVAARPWGVVTIDGLRIGYTSIAAHRVAPGRHQIRFEPHVGTPIDTAVTLGDRQAVRLSWVTRSESTGDSRLDSVIAVLEAGHTERGAMLLRQWLDGDIPPAVPPLPSGRGGQGERTSNGGLALTRLAEAAWALGARDSARAILRELVEKHPFDTPPPDVFNPDLQSAYRSIRRETVAVSVRAPSDTVVTPGRDSLPIQIAVGRPGEVRLLLRLTTPRPRDSLVAALRVDSGAVVSMPVSTPDGGPLPLGQYAVEARVTGAGPGASTLVVLTVERLDVDTAPHRPPIEPAALRPESKRGSPSLSTLAAGIGLGAAPVALSAAINDPLASGQSVPGGAWIVGGSVTLAYLFLKRPHVPIPENVTYNEARRAEREAENRAIAADNATRLRLAPLRVRAAPQP